MNSDTLCEYAEENDIDVMYAILPACGSISAQAESGNDYIAIDDRDMTEAEKTVHLAHEIGHCMTGAFYRLYSPLETRARCEYKANKWAIKKVLPKGRILTAFKRGYTELWQLAEYFNITEDMIEFACEYYFNKGK